ncbi:class I SAM-dependent methyltransferase [Exiguobacterium sp. TDN 0502]|uniref:class I SAM-dependent methyltransferase n=1 Tax=Exiguobacterium sp. TDN 0502 TaxID=3420731 RepID=UPI003D77875B
MKTLWNQFIDQQYAKPRGIIGTSIGEIMVRQHHEEMKWTIDLLRVEAGEAFLELGTGAGHAVSYLLSRTDANHVTGLDFSKTMVRSATVRNRRAIQAQRATIQQADFNHLTLLHETVDGIFSIHTIYFWESVGRTLQEMHRALRPGGRFVLTYCDGKAGSEWLDLQKQIEQEFIPLAEQAGFMNVAIKRGPVIRSFHTVALVGYKERAR